jgi:hypothetical protein
LDPSQSPDSGQRPSHWAFRFCSHCFLSPSLHEGFPGDSESAADRSLSLVISPTFVGSTFFESVHVPSEQYTGFELWQPSPRLHSLSHFPPTAPRCWSHFFSGAVLRGASGGEAASEDVRGASVGEAVTGAAVAESVRGTAVSESWTGSAVGAVVWSAAVGEVSTGAAVGEVVRGTPVSESWTGSAVGAYGLSAAVGEVSTGAPVSEVVWGAVALDILFCYVATPLSNLYASRACSCSSYRTHTTFRVSTRIDRFFMEYDEDERDNEDDALKETGARPGNMKQNSC